MQWLESTLEAMTVEDVKMSYAAGASRDEYFTAEALVLKKMVEQLEPSRPGDYLTGTSDMFFSHLQLTREMHRQRALRFENRINDAF